MDALEAIIRSEIEGTGFITFERFMDLALYHSEYGYYRRPEKVRTGRAGDYITSVSVGPLFGRLLACQFYEAWHLLGQPSPFWLVEQGAEDGALACDILRWVQTASPDFFSALRYAVMEPGENSSNHLSQRARFLAAGLGEKVAWYRALSDVRVEAGIVFANELVDAFPVHRIVRRGGKWSEVVVSLHEKNLLCVSEREIENNDLQAAVRDLRAVDGYVTEVNLNARRWMKEVGGVFDRGYVFTIDYGFPASVYYAAHRREGTLTAYREHQRIENPLSEPGELDLTAHVDFTALTEAGEHAGLTTLGFLDQQHFLLGIAYDELAGVERCPVGIPENTRAWNTLTHPNHLGASFQVLVQGKNAPASLAGLRFGGNGVRQLTA